MQGKTDARLSRAAAVALLIVLAFCIYAENAAAGSGTGPGDEPEPLERVSVIGDSWCSGLEWIGFVARRLLDLHCEPATTSRDWNWDRVRRLDLQRVVYLQLGGNDHLRWIEDDGRSARSQWHPNRTGRRLRRLQRALERRGHTVYALGYNGNGTEELGAAAMGQLRYCRDPRGEVVGDGVHLTPEDYSTRAAWLVLGGCHR